MVATFRAALRCAEVVAAGRASPHVACPRRRREVWNSRRFAPRSTAPSSLDLKRPRDPLEDFMFVRLIEHRGEEPLVENERVLAQVGRAASGEQVEGSAGAGGETGDL